MANTSGTELSPQPITDISEAHRNVNVFSVAIFFSGGKVETKRKKKMEQVAKSCTINDPPRSDGSVWATVSTPW